MLRRQDFLLDFKLGAPSKERPDIQLGLVWPESLLSKSVDANKPDYGTWD